MDVDFAPMWFLNCPRVTQLIFNLQHCERNNNSSCVTVRGQTNLKAMQESESSPRATYSKRVNLPLLPRT